MPIMTRIMAYFQVLCLLLNQIHAKFQILVSLNLQDVSTHREYKTHMEATVTNIF